MINCSKMLALVLAAGLWAGAAGQAAAAPPSAQNPAPASAAVTSQDELWQDFAEAYFIQTAAAACSGVYYGQKAVSFDFLRDRGWQVLEPITISGKEAQPRLAVASNYFADLGKQIYLVTFRGSISRRDWELDLTTRQVAYGGHSLREMAQVAAQEEVGKGVPAVHGGFNTYVQTVLDQAVLEDRRTWKGVFKEAVSREDGYLILCGHSLGGAAATLLGQRLLDLGFPQDKLGVVTFGAPAVANAAFAAAYGERLNLVRVVNKLDPIPGSLQTFFSGFRQFGREREYRINAQEADYQHPISLYFDQGMVGFYQAADRAAAAKLLRLPPQRRVAQGKPVVAVWVLAAPNLVKRPLGPYLKRFIADEYRAALPYYLIIQEDLPEDGYQQQDLLQRTREAGADYALICGVNSRQPQDASYWYINLEQALFSAKGGLMTMGSYGRRVGQELGQFQAAGEAFLEARADLKEALPYLVFTRPGQVAMDE